MASRPRLQSPPARWLHRIVARLHAALATLRATFHFEIRKLLAEAELFGTSHEVEHGLYRLRFTFPIEADPQDHGGEITWEQLDSRFPPRDPFPPLEEFEGRRTDLTIGTSSHPAVSVLRVECFFEGPFGAGDFAGLEEELKEASVFSAAVDATREAGRVAREGLRGFLDWVRVRGQHWLGPDAGSPRALGHAELVDLDTGQLLPTRIRLEPSLVIRTVKEHQVLNAERVADALEAVNHGTGPPLEDLLRADALYLLQDAEPPDFARAVITAAIACEVKIKRTLRHSATEEQQELVDLLLNNPHDWSLALLALFDGR
jgi:hypothetical protein